ncbi:hypothetical protein ACOMHN_007838 [Nucella lapillus]
MAAATFRTASSEEYSSNSYLEKCLQKNWKVFHKTLADFPHSFQLESVEQLSKVTWQKLLNALVVDLNEGLPTPLETAGTQNLVGYFNFLLNNPRDALNQIEEALGQSDEERNLVSLGNKVVILWQTGQRDKAKEQHWPEGRSGLREVNGGAEGEEDPETEVGGSEGVMEAKEVDMEELTPKRSLEKEAQRVKLEQKEDLGNLVAV